MSLRLSDVFGVAWSGRHFAFEGDPVHDPQVSMVVVERIVLRAAVIPESDRSRLPVKAAAEFFPLLHAIEILEQRC